MLAQLSISTENQSPIQFSDLDKPKSRSVKKAVKVKCAYLIPSKALALQSRGKKHQTAFMRIDVPTHIQFLCLNQMERFHFRIIREEVQTTTRKLYFREHIERVTTLKVEEYILSNDN